MRIATSTIYAKQMKYLQNSNTALDAASERYNTGLKFTTAGEDPAGMSTKIKYTADIAEYDQYAVNAGSAYDSLSEAETALSTMYDILSSIQTSLIQSVNGTMDTSSLTALAEEIEQYQAQLFDLMNTKNAEGEYIFSGAQSTSPAIELTSDGNYVCVADGSQRSVQVSPNVTVQVTESALNIFQNCSLAYSASIAEEATATNGTLNADGEVLGTYNLDSIVSWEISDYDEYYDVFEDLYSSADAATTNYFTIEILASTDVENEPRTFIVYDAEGNEIDRGEVTDDGYVITCGLTFDIGDDLTEEGIIQVNLDDPEKDNILNVLNTVIAALTDETLTEQERDKILAAAQVSVQNAKDQYDSYRGAVGARANTVDAIIDSNNALSDIKTEALANICEVDTYEALSDMIQLQYQLQIAQQTYVYVVGTSLFDYI